MVPLKAIKAFPFAGKTISVGAPFQASDSEAKTLIAVGYAERAVQDMSPAEQERVEQTYATAAIAADEQPRRARGPDKKQRKYRRRDMVAE